MAETEHLSVGTSDFARRCLLRTACWWYSSRFLKQLRQFVDRSRLQHMPMHARGPERRLLRSESTLRANRTRFTIKGPFVSAGTLGRGRRRGHRRDRRDGAMGAPAQRNAVLEAVSPKRLTSEMQGGGATSFSYGAVRDQSSRTLHGAAASQQRHIWALIF